MVDAAFVEKLQPLLIAEHGPMLLSKAPCLLVTTEDAEYVK